MNALTPDILRALAPASGFKLVDRYLPNPYRRALKDGKTPMGAITRATRDTLKRVDFDLEQLQKSRSVAFFTDLSDGAALGAMHDQTPWPEETTEGFRTRLNTVSILALQGAASARRMLQLIAVATNSELLSAFSYNPLDPTYSVTHNTLTLSGNIELGQTRGIFAKPDAPTFVADVLDAPLRAYSAVAKPLPRPEYVFELDNPSFKTHARILGQDERTFPDPMFDIEVGQDLGPFALIQVDPRRLTHAPRVIVVNRVLRAGSTLTIDPATALWDHSASDRLTTRGPFTIGGAKDSIYAGLSEIASTTSFFDNEPSDVAAGYTLDIRLKSGLSWTGKLVDEMIDQGAIPQGSGTKLQMPSLLSDGISRWHLVSLKPHQNGSTEVLDASFKPIPSNAKIKITARWNGRRAGEFALRFDENTLSVDSLAPQPHRVDWLDRMVNRFKLAGTIRVIAADGDSFKALPEPDIEIGLDSSVSLSSTLDIDDGMHLNSPIAITDTLDLHPLQSLDLASNTALTTEFNVNDVPPDAILNADVKITDALGLFPITTLDISTDTPLSTSLTLGDSGPIFTFDTTLNPTADIPRPLRADLKFDTDTPLGDDLTTGEAGPVLTFDSGLSLDDDMGSHPRADLAFNSETPITDRMNARNAGPIFGLDTRISPSDDADLLPPAELGFDTNTRLGDDVSTADAGPTLTFDARIEPLDSLTALPTAQIGVSTRLTHRDRLRLTLERSPTPPTERRIKIDVSTRIKPKSQLFFDR